jgi:hypothetical protein
MQKMGKTSIAKLIKEVAALRRDVSLLVPTESLSGYKHSKRITASYKKALASHPLHAGHHNS